MINGHGAPYYSLACISHHFTYYPEVALPASQGKLGTLDMTKYTGYSNRSTAANFLTMANAGVFST